MTTFLEWMSASAAVVQTVAVVVTAFFGIRALNTWRYERIGGRRIDLAEQILAKVTEVGEAIAWATDGSAFSQEIEELAAKLGYPRPDIDRPERQKVQWLVPALRLQKKHEVIQELGRVAMLGQFYFGEEVSQAANEIREVVMKIQGASRTLFEITDFERQHDLVEKLQQVIWLSAYTDHEPNMKMKAAQERLQGTLGPELAVRPRRP